MSHSRRGLTLVELLVVLAVLAVLMGMLVPAVGSARETAREAGCAAMQDELFLSAVKWAFDHHDKIPGVNTSGAHLHGNFQAQVDLLFDTSPDSPTSSFDWMSPALGAAAELSPNRAERTRQLFDRFACPSAHYANETLWGWSPDLAEFTEILGTRGYPQISYLSPAAFHLLGPANGLPVGKHWGWLGPAVTPRGYLPRLDRIGKQPASKIFLADGTRYVGAGGQLDFDVDPAPDYFGSFTSSGPIYVASTAYGLDRHLMTAVERGGRPPIAQDAPQHNRDLSYRHRGRLGAIRFDGSFLFLTEEESRTDAVPWYPSGSEFTGFRATAAAKANHAEGERLW